MQWVAIIILFGAVIYLHDEIESLRMNINALSIMVRDTRRK